MRYRSHSRCVRSSFGIRTVMPAIEGQQFGNGERTPARSALLQVERDRVDAVALARAGRSVIEHVPEMSTAGRAADRCPRHAVAGVHVEVHVGAVGRLAEAGPARSRIELGIRVEQLRAAPRASVHAVLLGIDVGARERPLRPLLSHHVVLVGRELLTPLLLALPDLRAHRIILLISASHIQTRTPSIRYTADETPIGRPSADRLGGAPRRHPGRVGIPAARTACRSPGANVSNVPAAQVVCSPPALTCTSPATTSTTARSCTLWSPSSSPSLRSITTARHSGVENSTFGSRRPEASTDGMCHRSMPPR